MVIQRINSKCKLKCYVKPIKDPLGVSPSKGNQGTTRGKEKILLTSVGIEPVGLSWALHSTLIYTAVLILCTAIYRLHFSPQNGCREHLEIISL